MRRDLAQILLIVAGVLILAFAGPWFVHEFRTLPAHSLAARSGQRIVTLEVGGMTCTGCAATIEASLSRVPGVATVAVRYPQRRAYVVCDPGVADSALVAAVSRAGPGFLGAVAER